MAPTPPLEPHVVIFPFMAHGHTLPLLDLSKALSHRRIKVTVITTPSNAKSISDNVAHHQPYITILPIPFPTDIDIDALGLPHGIENTSQLPSMDFWFPFVLATKQLQKPFEQVLQSMWDSKSLPMCVISDFFLGWTLKSCRDFGVPRLVFHGMGVLSMAISKSVITHKPHLNANSLSDPLDFPAGLNLPFSLTTSELPETLLQADDPNDPFSQFIHETDEADVNSWGVIVNSFEGLESCNVSSFESFYEKGAKAWCLGPLNLYDKLEGHAANKNIHISKAPIKEKKHGLVLTEWLNDHVTTPGPVIYVSFGTQAYLSEAQLDEVVFGLEEAGVPFVLAVRSTTWSAPDGLEDRLRGKGLITREWVDQRQILSHRAVGGFLSHCGWNSVIESISAGVPVLAWPMIAEQPLNAKLVVEALGAGIGINKVKLNKSVSGFEVSRQAICEGVRELMLGGEKGRNARERVQALGRVAWRAVQEGGSSCQALDKLIDQLRASSAP